MKDGEIIECPKCGTRLGKFDGHDFHIRKPSNRVERDITISVKHDAGGSMSITCDSCGSTFSRTDKTLGMSYVVAPKKSTDKEDLH